MIDERELESLGQHRRGAPGTPSSEIVRRGLHLRRRSAAVKVGGAAATAVVAVVMVLLAFTAGDQPGYQVRVANGPDPALHRNEDGGFPHLLIGGWQLVRADDQERAWPANPDGSGRYHSSEATFTRRAAQVTLHMTEGDAAVRDDLIKDRGEPTPDKDQQNKQEQGTVLGYPATITYYRGSNQTSAIWFADQVVYELVLDIGDRDVFFDALGTLRVVDAATWKAALPATAVSAGERPAEVDRILADIPQPPGFDAGPLREGKAAVDRYQLGAEVAGTVACAWVDRWIDARQLGDGPTEREAVEAMRTSRKWHVLNDMNAEGDYPEGVWQIADAMAADGRFADYPGRTLEQYAPDYNLGCASR